MAPRATHTRQRNKSVAAPTQVRRDPVKTFRSAFPLAALFAVATTGLVTGDTLLALGAAGAIQRDVILFPVCKGISVTLTSEASTARRGEKPQFSVAVSNATDRPVRILDVRNGRRADLQDTYFELFVVQQRTTVGVPAAISDPGPLSEADFFELRPGARIEIPRISYTRALEQLRPGRYEAFVLFWRDPMDAATRCRSTSATFNVQRKSSNLR